MKLLGLILIGIGFLGGALVAVLQIDELSWPAYTTTLLIGVVGLVLVRRETHAGASDHDHVHGNLATLHESLTAIRAGLETLSKESDAIPPHQFRFEIDHRFRSDLNRFAEARESMKHAFSIDVYADIMSAFAAGERYLNRIWTASADGYIDEVLKYVEKARAQFGEACEEFERHYQRANSAGKEHPV